MATGMVHNITLLIVIRFMLGVVESAVMPSMLIFLSRWFTKSERSQSQYFFDPWQPGYHSCGCPLFRAIWLDLWAGAGCSSLKELLP